MTTDLDLLEVHALGAGKGESIVLRWPGNKWGVVDCYAPSLEHADTNPTLRFLKDRCVSELEFLCLTHPHDDHFRGMSHLLKEFRVRYFWRFAGLSGPHLRKLAQYFVLDAERSGVPEMADNASDFARTMALVNAKRGADELRQKTATGYQQLYPVPADQSAQFQIWSFAPSGNQVGSYEETLAACFTEDGHFRGSIPYADHNSVSVGLLVRFGETLVILGGDIEGPGWEDALLELQEEDLSADAVKVSHHGSVTGYVNGLWEILARKKKPIAIIVPYRRFQLPKEVAIDHISTHAAKIMLTCDSGTAPSSSRAAPLKSRAALRSRFGARHAPADGACGRCTLAFDTTGNCVASECVSPAHELENQPR